MWSVVGERFDASLRTCVSIRLRSTMADRGGCLTRLYVWADSVYADYTCIFAATLGQLWDGCMGVSNAGKKKGRGKRGASKRVVKLYIGKSFGYGKQRALFCLTALHAVVVY